MRCGWPQPMTTISVGGERAERESGVMEDANVRRYSWQFCGRWSVSLAGRRRERRGVPYTTEKMSDEYYQNAAGPILVVGIQALESTLVLILIQHGQVGGFVQVSFGRWIVVGLDIAFEIRGRVFASHFV